jgi:hypothetical protein
MRNTSPKHAKDGSAGTNPPGVISAVEIYTIEEAKARLGWTDSALRAAKRRGLQLLACGKRRYVAGEEIVRFLKSLQIASVN